MKPTKQEQMIFDIIGPCLTEMRHAVSQLHFSHWLTTKNHHHTILGELYTELQDEVDELAEEYLGAYIDKYSVETLLATDIVTKKSYSYEVIKNERQLMDYINKLANKAKEDLEMVSKTPEVRFLQESLSEIIAVFYGAKYQISQQ